MIRPLLAALPIAAMLATPAAAAPRKSDREALANAKPAGPPVDCIQIRGIRETRVRSDQVIDFIMTNRRVYRNTLPNRCPSLGFREAFSYRTSLSRLCGVDIITVIDTANPRFSGPSCGLGQFQPVTGVKR